MTIETVDKCLGYASGNKTYQVATRIRNENFPQNLLSGNKEEQELRRLREEGYTFIEIRNMQGKTGVGVYMYMIDTMHRKEELYNAWTEFWTESAEIRPMRLSALCEGKLSHKSQVYLDHLERAKVLTIEDFLIDCSTMTVDKMKKKYGLSATEIREGRNEILQLIRGLFPHCEDGVVIK